MSSLIELIKYLFNPAPGSYMGSRYVILAAAIVLIALSFILRFYLRKNKNDKALKNTFKGYVGHLQTIGILLGLYLVFRYASLPFLSARAVLYVIIGAIIYIFGRAIYDYKKVYPDIKEKYKAVMEKEKYMPGKKKRK